MKMALAAIHLSDCLPARKGISTKLKSWTDKMATRSARIAVSPELEAFRTVPLKGWYRQKTISG